jgi:hypothetical protein
VKIKPSRFVTQIEYRGEGKKIILGWIGDFKTTTDAKQTLNEEGFPLTYKSSVDGIHWSRTWTGYNGAIEQLLIKHGKDPIRGGNRVVPIPETWASDWKPLDYCEDYHPNNR